MRLKLIAVSTACFVIMSSNYSEAKRKPGPAQRELETYVQEAKRRSPGEVPNTGSLWLETGRNSNLYNDHKARGIDDIVTIKIVESTNALSSGGTTGAKQSSTSSSVPNLFGWQKKYTELANLLKSIFKTDFKGTSSTNRSQTLKTSITARVTDVLPNGNLLIEAAKEVRVNGENQVLTVSGVVRPRDISTDNVVASDAIADMQVKLNGRGIIRDHLNPGAIFSLLAKVFLF